jgi:hypothetical protein
MMSQIYQDSRSQVAAPLVLVAAIIAIFIGLQLQQYLQVACIVRGECYGRGDWLYLVSLISVPVTTVMMATGLLLVLSLLAPFLFPLRFLQAQGLFAEVNKQSVVATARLLSMVSGILFILASMIAWWFSIH